jgi:hypothetical protein
MSRTAERCGEGLQDLAGVLLWCGGKSRPQLQDVGTGERKQLLLTEAMHQGSVGRSPRESIAGI